MTRYRIADLIAETIRLNGGDRAFSVPGESFLGLLDALRDMDDIDVVTCRHEGSAGLAAVADAKLTGRPGVLMVSRGPGLFNAGLSLHVAQQEAIPMLVFVGQVDRGDLTRGAVQEVDGGRAFLSTAKWHTRLDRGDRAAERLARAFAVSQTGTPGPVVIELPEDALLDEVNDQATAFRLPRPGPTLAEVEEVVHMITHARKPLILVGSEDRSSEFRSSILAVAEAFNIPVMATNKCQDQFPNTHPLWAGQLGFFPTEANKAKMEATDLLIAVGTQMGDLDTLGYSAPSAATPVIHVFPDQGPLAHLRGATLPVLSGSRAFLIPLANKAPIELPDRRTWLKEIARLQSTPTTPSKSDIWSTSVAMIAQCAEMDAVITTDSGNFAAAVHANFRFNPEMMLLGSACGAMGTGVPSGLAAALRTPGRQVLAFCGDGGFAMTGLEMATAVDRAVNLKVIVCNNASFGTIAQHQERQFPGREYGTKLAAINFMALAQAFGFAGHRISRLQEVANLQEIIARPEIAIIEILA
ncbi:thiamine pyrophosphate-dependent enzyme [Paracoccus saliphilus]|uniref:Acetolactate synthase-1/2/3 large subunit n=1 Tax=Paracoccus saliphilus TaxID=405559 RepID=A0AA45W2L2_9RHOB|nr:thiamine pyrophosphate-dependent enzyme [Paracoccus saliphilus]WCR01459.1 hypothetical protein JHX88_10885 [Paracoccus saliphilus]SIS69197.1 acetolactate synthase-1/2/3 large subunit [Paracoccus saliphilus]